MTQKVAHYMLQRIKVYNQFTTKWCSMFAIAHALAIMFKEQYKDVVVNPYSIVRLAFLHKGFRVILNRAMGIQEIMAALQEYGLWVKLDGKRTKIFPGSLIEISEKELKQYLGKRPILATGSKIVHSMVLIGVYPENPVEYVVVDSASRKGYSHVNQSYFNRYFIIFNYSTNE